MANIMNIRKVSALMANRLLLAVSAGCWII
jgi:hypothetical protein